MQIHYLGRQIRRCQRNILSVCAILLCVLLLPLVVGRRYFANYLLGPLQLTASELQNVQRAESLSRYFVTLRCDAFSETGIGEVMPQPSGSEAAQEEGTLQSEILLLHMGEQRLALKAPPGQRGSEWSGGLHTVESELAAQLADVIAASPARPVPQLLPVYLDATGFRRPGHFLLAIILPGLATVLWVMARAARRYRNIRTHPILKTIERYGDPGSVLLQIDAEAEAAGGHMASGLTLVTASYLIFGGEYRVDIVRFADIVWAHASTIVHRKFGIPMIREHMLCVYDKWGQKIELPAPGRTPRGLLKIIRDRAPGAFIGESKELTALWARHPARLVAQIQAGARQQTGKPAADPAEHREG